MFAMFGIFLCTRASLYALYSFLLISNKFWMEGGGEDGESENKRCGAGWLTSLMHLSSPSEWLSSFIHLLLHPPHGMGPETSLVGFLCTKPPMHLWFIQPCASCFGCMHIHYKGKWEGVWPWNSRVFWALWNGIKPIGEGHLGLYKS